MSPSPKKKRAEVRPGWPQPEELSPLPRAKTERNKSELGLGKLRFYPFQLAPSRNFFLLIRTRRRREEKEKEKRERGCLDKWQERKRWPMAMAKGHHLLTPAGSCQARGGLRLPVIIWPLLHTRHFPRTKNILLVVTNLVKRRYNCESVGMFRR